MFDDDNPSTGGRFSWSQFKSAINDYEGDNLTFDKFKTVTIPQNESTVGTMVEKITKYFVHGLNVTMDGNVIEALTSTIEATFTNLKETNFRSVTNFHESKNARNSSLEYRIQFAFPDPDLPDFFFTLVTTIRLRTHIIDEKWWWGLSTSSTREFSAEIDAIRLVVKEGFTAPVLT